MAYELNDMDAQNAVESTSAKQPASPRRGPDETHDPKSTSSPAAKSPVASKPASSTNVSTSATDATNAQDDDAPNERDSDAETIVLSGKDGISPSKPRKLIKHEDKSDGEIDQILPVSHTITRDGKDAKEGERRGGGAPVDDAASSSSLGRTKRSVDKRAKDGSSGLSSAPASPPSHHRRNHSLSHQRRRSGGGHSESDSESSKPTSPKLSKEKAKSVDRLLSQKRKAPKAESDDEAESRKARRPRISDTSIDTSLSSKYQKDHRQSSGRSHQDKAASSRTRSVSPHGRGHRRSLSTQLPSQSSNGLSHKKRRVPAPLQPTDYRSDDSSASGSPPPRSSRLKSMATPGTGDSNMSPAKMAPHKKHLDAHGQTLFAKACAKGEYDVAKVRLQERPEDLNFADHAGNTPLQVASLNGHEDVVGLLIGAGCNLECRNDVKDTPLLDAVENGHLGVVKLLLAAGVNPRKPNAEGQEPLEKITDDLDNGEEIKAALIEAKQRMGELRRTSEDHLPHDNQDAASSGAESPRRSPTASVSGALAAASRRAGTVRSTKTSNHLLYMSLDDKTLRQAAARGDHETVTRVLQVKESCDDAEALVAAARGGHNFVMELLLALGGANPDPAPVKVLPSEHSTPMLAAIGQENTKVIQLLLNQSGFDPTRRFKGETYYEIARRREGPMWKDEEHMLKNAYDGYRKSHKGSSKTKSPPRRERDLEQDSKRPARTEAGQDNVRSHKRRPSSPARDADSKKKLGSNKSSSSPKEKRRSQSFGNNDDQTSPKRGPGRPKKDDKIPTIAISDREASPALSSKAHAVKAKRTESDVAGSSDGEAAKPRRKLISGKDLKGQREKQRRASMVSNNSTRDASDRGDSKHDEVPEKSRADLISEKYHDRTKALKRDDSRDRLSPSDSSSKRTRASLTPPRHGLGDKDETEAPVKRRKLDADGKEKRSQQNSSPDDRQRKRDVSRDSTKRQKPRENERKESSSKAKKINRERKESGKSSPSEKASITVYSEELDVDMADASSIVSMENREAQLEREREESKKRQAEVEAAAAEEARKKEEEKRRGEEEKIKREAEEKRQKVEAEKKRLEEEEKERREEEERKRIEEEEKVRLEAERAKREEEERKQKEEEERKQKEEEERKRLEEEERIRHEKEAAEEARKLREEEERKERERKRAAREAELMRIRQEQERLRLSKLPPLLRWLDGSPDPRQRELAELFTIMQGVRYDTINPSATGRPDGREQWLLNTQVALLLGEKDLGLSRCTFMLVIPGRQGPC